MTEPRDIAAFQAAREKAIARLKKKSDFLANLLAYVLVNGVLIVIWLVTGAGFFWPIFFLLFWGIGLVFHAREVYWQRPISEEEIRREMDRIR